MWLFQRSAEPLLLVQLSTGLVVDFNQAGQRLLQLNRDQIVGATCTQLFDRDIHQLMEEKELVTTLPGCDALRFNVSCAFVDKAIPLHVIVSIQPASCSAESAVSPPDLLAAPSSESQEKESADHRSREVAHLKSLLDDLGAIVWEATLPYNGITYISRQLTPTLGYSVDEWIDDPMSWENSILEEDRERTVSFCKSSTALGEDHRLEYRAKHADGHIVWIEDRISVITDASGTPTLMRGLMLDVSARKNYEEAIRRQRELHHLLVENAPVCIHSIDESGNVESINATGLRLVGAESTNDVQGKRYLDFVAEADQERIGRLLADAYRGKSSTFQFTCLTRCGERTFDSNFIPIIEPDGGVCKIIGTSEDVTESQETLEQLRIRERAIDSASMGILLAEVKNDSCQLVFCNPALHSITGWESDQILGSDGSALVIDDSGLTMHQLLTATMNSEQSKSVVHRTSRDTGDVKYNEISVSAVRDSESRITHLVCFIDDTTDRVSIERRLRESEHLFRTLSEHSPNGVLLCDRRGAVSYINDEGARIVGLSELDCLGTGWMSALHPSDRVRIDAEFERLFDDGAAFAVEVRFERFDDSEAWVYFRANPRRDESGQLFGYVGSMVDITKRKRDEKNLIQSEQRFRDLVDSDPEAILIYDVDADRIVDWNQNAIDLFRFADAEILKQAGLSDILPPLQPDNTSSMHLVRSKVQLALKGDKVTYEMYHRDTSGRLFPCEVRLVNFPSQNQNLLRASLIDVSALRAAQRKMTCVRLATERFSDAMYVVALNGSIVDVNHSACLQLGYSRAELLSMKAWEIKQAFSSEQWPELWDHIKRSNQFVNEEVHVRKDGTHFCVEASAAYANTDEELIVAIARDITLRNEAHAKLREHERQLAQVSRQLVMGELVAGIAHEVNQPLYSIVNFSKASKARLSGLLDSLERMPPGTDVHSSDTISEMKFWLSKIEDWNSNVVMAADNAGSIIRRMANFAKKSPSAIVPAKINEAIEDALKLLAHQIRQANVVLCTDLMQPDMTVPIDRVQIQQIVVNLVINAIEALESAQSARRNVTIRTQVVGERVILEVVDSGPGFPSDAENSFVDAFASTKKDSMGMGLAIINTIAETSDSNLTFGESDDGGAAVRFFIPLIGEGENV